VRERGFFEEAAEEVEEEEDDDNDNGCKEDEEEFNEEVKADKTAEGADSTIDGLLRLFPLLFRISFELSSDWSASISKPAELTFSGTSGVLSSPFSLP